MSAERLNGGTEGRPDDLHAGTDALASTDVGTSRWSRRAFIAAGAATAAALFPGRLLAAIERATPPLPDLSSWAAVRGQFPLDRSLRHFASFYITSHPRPVQQAIDAFRHALDANPVVTVEHGMFEGEASNLPLKVLGDMAQYLDARPEEIALTPNTTTGLALVYHGLPFRPGDEILTTTHDHYVHHESIRLAAERTGASVRRVTLYDRGEDASADEIVGRLRKAIRPETRTIGVTWVHSSTGVRLPIRAIAAAVADANRGRDEKDRARLVVDGVHGLGVADEAITEMGCDFFSAGTHKWMFGPRGTGLLWGRSGEWARLRPTIPTFSNLDAYQAWMEERPPSATTAAHVTPGGFLPYEHQWATGAAFRMHTAMGKARVAARIRALNDQCKAGLAAIKRVRLHTPLDPALSAGIVAFEVDGLTPEEIVKRLHARRIIASTSPYKVSYARLAPSLVNDPAEVDEALRAIREIAGA